MQTHTHLIPSLSTIYPPAVAEERARNLAHFLGTVTFEDVPTLWADVIATIALRWEQADPYATSGRACDKSATLESVALGCLRAWVLGNFTSPPSEFAIFTALKGLGVPDYMLKAAA